MSDVSKRPSAGVLTPEEITDYWDGIAEHYSINSWLIDHPGGQLGRSPAEINAWRLVWRRVLGPPPLRVLDVGTGTGMVALLLALLGYEVSDVDAAERMLAEARHKAGDAGLSVRFQRGLADQLPYADDTFDAVVSRSLLHTLLEPEAAVREWRRCTRPGGRIAAVNLRYDSPSPLAWLHRWLNNPAQRRRFGSGYSNDPERTAQLPLHHAHRDAFSNVFHRAGLERILVEDLTGTDLLERRRVRRPTKPWIPHFLIEGTIPQATARDAPPAGPGPPVHDPHRAATRCAALADESGQHLARPILSATLHRPQEILSQLRWSNTTQLYPIDGIVSG